MVIDRFILEVADEYEQIGTIYERLLSAICGYPIDVPTFACVFARVGELIRKDLLEHKYVRLPRGGRYVQCRRNRRW